jgi:glycosyltransferase involved in cell wall biosynthesis
VAIEAARRLGLPLILAGKVDPTPEAQVYFSKRVAPYFGRGVSWIPNVSGAEKAKLLSRARAMVFPLDWEEPFGIAMVEAMASGTPVIAFPRGAAPELIENGVTGFLVNDVDQMVDAYAKAREIDPYECARRARDRFSPARMAAGYEEIYRQAVEARELLTVSAV